MRILKECFEANRKWAARTRERDPGFFERLGEGQKPELLWIGCSDSRLVPNMIIGRPPGALFVHRNVGNLVVSSDMNCLSVLQYGVEVLGVRHVIVCGHYGCGGVKAAMSDDALGLIDNWLVHIRDVEARNRAELDALPDLDARANRLCELNVVAQVVNVCNTTVVRDAWRRAQPLGVHGWVYSFEDGLLRDLDLCVDGPALIPRV
jgi:carbonic anhydrase